MKQRILLKNNTGQGLIEYVIIVAIVAVGAMSLVRVLHQSVNVQFAQIAKALGAKTSQKIAAPEISSTMLHRKDLTNFMKGARGNSKDDDQNETEPSSQSSE